MKYINSLKGLGILILFFSNLLLSVSAQDYDLDTSLNDYYPIPEANKPGYLQSTIDPIFGTKITRITGDVGTAVTNVSGETWRNIARHGYSNRQPWNADESIIYLGKHKSSGGGWGASLFLDGETYEVIKKANIASANEARWHPTNPDLFLLLRDTGIYTWSYSTGDVNQLMSLSGYSNLSTGHTGNYTNDGTMISVFANRNSDGKQVVFAIDFENNIKHPDIDFSGVDIDWLSISPLGNYTMVNGNYGQGIDRTKVYDLQGNQVGPYWSEYGRPSHFDVAVDENGIEYAVGNSKSNPDEGRIIKRRLSDGVVTVLSQVGFGSHGSARSINRLGWVITSQSSSRNWGPYYNEIVAAKLDGTRVERICSIRSSLVTYDNETQACPSPSGSRIIYASDWNNGTYPVQGYIVDFRDKQIGGNGGNRGVNAGNDQEICLGSEAVLTASGAQSYVWSTGETTASISVTPNSTTTYTVTGTDENGETTTDSVIVTVNEIPTANAGEDVEVCEGDEVSLTASGGTSYLWNTGEITQTISVSPNSTTNYSVIVTQNSCSSTDEVTVTVRPRQTINAGNDVDIYFGESTTLTVTGIGDILWSTGETTASIEVSPTNNTTYTVEVTEANGCTATDEVTVNVIGSVDANAGADFAICDGESATLTASGGDYYLWNTGETTATITINPTETTTYTVEVSTDYTSESDNITVYVNEIPEVNAGDNTEITLGEYVTLSASGADSYLWSNGATQPNIAVSPQQTTTYYVTGFTNNCSDVASVTVSVSNAVNAYAGKDQLICSGDELTLTATGGDDYLWSTGETTQSIKVSPESDTIYTVVVSNAYASASDDVLVEVIECEEAQADPNYQYDIYPNPVSDGILKINLGGLTDNSNIYIHDAIGKLVYFETIDPNNGLIFQKQINVSRLNVGMYFVTLEETNQSTTKKIIFR